MTGLIDAFASQYSHYHAHLKPILDALPDDRRGHFYTASNSRHDIFGEHVRYGWPPDTGGPLVVAGFQDLRYTNRRKILCSHGAAQTYLNCDSPSYDGGPGREQVGLFLGPNERSSDANLARYPDARAVAVGCPLLDAWAKIPAPGDGAIAVSWHWPCRLRDRDGNDVPESGWAFDSWRQIVTELAKVRPVIGHGHPRARPLLTNFWASIGVEAVWDPAEVLARSDVLLIDNSSLAFEFAACGRGVVLMDDPAWRTDVEHSLRFWSDIPGEHLHPRVGLDGLIAAIDDVSQWEPLRQQVTERVYGSVDGGASQRAVDAILQWEADGFMARPDAV